MTIWKSKFLVNLKTTQTREQLCSPRLGCAVVEINAQTGAKAMSV